LRAGESTLNIADEVHNLSSGSSDFQLLYHINFGVLFLSLASKLHAPMEQLAPRDTYSSTDIKSWNTYGLPQRGLAEIVHFLKLASLSDGTTSVLLKAAAAEHGAVLRYNTNQLPCFTL
jgi:hypothetical protein